ncbi:MAG: hypothetical protein AB3N23_12065 [Paracoccaceae bacterium]
MVGFLNCRTVLAAAIAALTAGSVAAQSLPENSFRLYGHFSPAAISYDDGAERYTNIADNSYSGGRIGFWFEYPAQFGRTRFNVESSLGLRQSASLSQFYIPPLIDIDATAIRKFEVIFDTDRLGSFSFGQGSMGSDAVTESDLSGTQLASYVGIADTAGGYFFRTASGSVSTVRIKDAFPTFDGGRAPRIRWDSPDLALSHLGTFRIAASAGLEVTDRNVVVNDALADVGLFYRNTLGNFDIKGSFGTSLADVNGETKPQSAGSISLLHNPSGWSATVATGARDGGGQYQYSKIALTRRWFDWGDTAASIDFYQGIDTVNSGSRSKSYGLGIVQDLDRSDLRLYLGLRRYEVSTNGIATHRPATSIIFGTRWVFKKLDQVHFARGRDEVDWTESE